MTLIGVHEMHGRVNPVHHWPTLGNYQQTIIHALVHWVLVRRREGERKRESTYLDVGVSRVSSAPLSATSLLLVMNIKLRVS